MVKRISEGYVDWPRYTHHDTGEGGMYVYAFVLGEGWNDPMLNCCGPDSVIDVNSQDVVISPDFELIEEGPVLAAIMLGSTGSSLFNEAQGFYFDCAYEDLTDGGRTLVNALKNMYPDGRKVKLVTFLDT